MVTNSDAKMAAGINRLTDSFFNKNSESHGAISIIHKINFNMDPILLSILKSMPIVRLPLRLYASGAGCIRAQCRQLHIPLARLVPIRYDSF